MRDHVSPLHPTPTLFEHLLCETLQPDVWPDGRDGEEVAQHLKAQVLGQMDISSNPSSLLRGPLSPSIARVVSLLGTEMSSSQAETHHGTHLGAWNRQAWAWV